MAMVPVPTYGTTHRPRVGCFRKLNAIIVNKSILEVPFIRMEASATGSASNGFRTRLTMDNAAAYWGLTGNIR